MKIIPRVFALILLVLTTYPKANSQDIKGEYNPFKVSYNIEYKIDPFLETYVNEEISLINLDYLSAPNQINIKIKNINIYDLKVFDHENKEQQITLDKNDEETNIKVPIKDPAIGKDKKTTIKVSYKTKDLVQKTGKITTINIPKPNISDLIHEYNIKILVPKEFGPTINISPQPYIQKMEEDGHMLEFKKENIKDYGINASFGDYQIFDFEIEETLKNDTLFNKIFKIPIPPNITNYQQVAIKEVYPEPIKIYKDLDENVIMYFKVKPKKEVKVKIAGQVQTYDFKTNNPNSSTNINPKLHKKLKKFTEPTNLWPSESEEIKEISKNIKTAKDAYDFVITNINYDYKNQRESNKISRKGALKTLKDKNGLYLDFNDLFITLTRSINIPSREVIGYAYSKENEDQKMNLHAWSQYYNPDYGWVSVDPTWGATSKLDYFNKLDNNRLAFIINSGRNKEIKMPSNVKINFSESHYFDSKSKFDISKLQTEPWPYKYKFLITFLGAALALGLYTIYHVLKAHGFRR